MAKIARKILEKEVRELLAQQLGIEPDVITATSSLADLGADSLDVVEAVITYEDLHKVQADDGADIKTFSDLIDALAAAK